MVTKIEKLDRMDKDFLKYVYDIRKQVFGNFPLRDRLIYNEWDALSKHFLLVCDGKPAGSIAVVDWTGLNDILLERGIDPSLKVAKFTKLAILPGHRGIQNLKKLIEVASEEAKNFDYGLAELFPPSDCPENTHFYKMGEKYSRLFELHKISQPVLNGIKYHIIGKNIKNNSGEN